RLPRDSPGRREPGRVKPRPERRRQRRRQRLHRGGGQSVLPASRRPGRTRLDARGPAGHAPRLLDSSASGRPRLRRLARERRFSIAYDRLSLTPATWNCRSAGREKAVSPEELSSSDLVPIPGASSTLTALRVPPKRPRCRTFAYSPGWTRTNNPPVNRT